MSSPYSPRTTSFLGPNIHLCLRISPNARDHVSDPNTTDNLTVKYMCILIFIFVDSKLADKRFCTKWQQAFPDFTAKDANRLCYTV